MTRLSNLVKLAARYDDIVRLLDNPPEPTTVSDTLSVGPDRDYATIAEAWDAAVDGDCIKVSALYDAQAANESFPIELDYREKEVTLSGTHPSRSAIDAGESDANVLEVVGKGSADYRNNPLVRDLRLEGGETGLRVRAAPFASFERLIFHGTGSHGFHIASHDDGGTFGVNLYNCQAFGCGGDGFRADRGANPHGTTYWGCRATANDGVGFRLRGTSSQVFGGTSQLNHDYGIEVRSGRAVGIDGTYIEGNARSNDYPVGLYANRAEGLTIENCYFHGINPRGANHDHERVQRAVNVHHSPELSLRNCTVRRYGDGFVATFNCDDAEFAIPSHTLRVDMFAVDPTTHGNSRPRSNGVILPSDPDSVEGRYRGDMLVHPEGGIVSWDGDKWAFSGLTASE